MSFEFNRRSFLKYTAAAAVAVAGSSLLTGCGQDEYQPTGKIGDTLTLMGKQTMYGTQLPATHPKEVTKPSFLSTDGKTLTCSLYLNCSAKFGNRVMPQDFEVEITRAATKKTESYHYGNADGRTLELSQQTNYLKEDASFATVLTVKNAALADGDKVNVMYWPKQEGSEGGTGYRRAYCTWSMTVYKTATGALSVKA